MKKRLLIILVSVSLTAGCESDLANQMDHLIRANIETSRQLERMNLTMERLESRIEGQGIIIVGQ